MTITAKKFLYRNLKDEAFESILKGERYTVKMMNQKQCWRGDDQKLYFSPILKRAIEVAKDAGILLAVVPEKDKCQLVALGFRHVVQARHARARSNGNHQTVSKPPDVY